MRGAFSNVNGVNLFLIIFPRKGLHSVQASFSTITRIRMYRKQGTGNESVRKYNSQFDLNSIMVRFFLVKITTNSNVFRANFIRRLAFDFFSHGYSKGFSVLALVTQNDLTIPLPMGKSLSAAVVHVEPYPVDSDLSAKSGNAMCFF